MAQVKHYLEDNRLLLLARAFVEAALYNILRVLKYYAGRLDEDEAEQVCEIVATIEKEQEGLEHTADIPDIMDLEGRCRMLYYQAWPALLGKSGADFPFVRRGRQPPPPTN